jgi:hypothetical protein
MDKQMQTKATMKTHMPIKTADVFSSPDRVSVSVNKGAEQLELWRDRKRTSREPAVQKRAQLRLLGFFVRFLCLTKFNIYLS